MKICPLPLLAWNALSISKKSFPGSSVCASDSRTLSIVVFFGGLLASDSLSEGILCMLIPFSLFRELLHPKTTHFQPFSLFNNKALPWIFAYFCTMSFSYVTLHIWTHLAEWGTNANDSFENELLKDMEIYQKKTNWRVRGTRILLFKENLV